MSSAILASSKWRILSTFGDKLIRDIVEITVNEIGFAKNYETSDTIYVSWLFVEKYDEKHPPPNIPSLNLKTKFDCAPYKSMWYALREHLCVGLNYSIAIRWSVANYRNCVSVGVFQWNAFSLVLFVLVMGTVTRAPYTLLYADHVLLASYSKVDFDQLSQKWNDWFIQHHLRLKRNKTRFWILSQWNRHYRCLWLCLIWISPELNYITVNCAMELVHAIAQFPWNGMQNLWQCRLT